MEINDMLCKHIYNIQAKISEKKEEIIMQTIREIGGETFYEITIDRDKVLEALTMYKNKDDYVEVKHGEWIKKPYISRLLKRTVKNEYIVTCSVCGFDSICESNYCRKCGAKMEGDRRE